MEEKKKSNVGLIVLVIVLLLACVGMGGFIFVNKDKLTSNDTTTVKNDNKKVNDNTSKCAEVSYDLKTSEYGLGDSAVGFKVVVDSSRKSAAISYNGATVSTTFSLGWTTGASTFTYEPIDTKSFSKKISQVLIDGYGQDASNATIFYLMEDGTVEYVPILKELNATWNQPDGTKKFNSYGQLEGISKVISLVPASVNQGSTVLARKADGTVIDLSETLKATGNYN